MLRWGVRKQSNLRALLSVWTISCPLGHVFYLCSPGIAPDHSGAERVPERDAPEAHTPCRRRKNSPKWLVTAGSPDPHATTCSILRVWSHQPAIQIECTPGLRNILRPGKRPKRRLGSVTPSNRCSIGRIMVAIRTGEKGRTRET